jgi:hypothetical protein
VNARSGLCLALVALALVACAEPERARFALRGRWPGERDIAYRIDAAGGPLAPAEFRAALGAALAQWEATGCVRFREGPEAPELVLRWETEAHADGVAFGLDPGVAHAGPVGPGTFVCFDPARDWGATLSLRQAALHELGHVLGLDHSPDETAVMYPEPGVERARLGASDRAALHSLYGGGTPARGDLVVRAADGGELVLHAVAPAGEAEWSLLDADGDGDDEILVWAPEEHGELWIHDFAPGPVLARTRGPIHGALELGQRAPNALADEGEGDLDGDGTRERVRRR